MLNDFIQLIKKVQEIDDAIKILKSQIEIDSTIQQAIDFSIYAHREQFRKSGEPYVIHPILVAAIVASISNEKSMVIAALLHDVVEDTEHTLEEINALFGQEVAHLVDGLTKIFDIREEKLPKSNTNERLLKSALSFRNLLLASIKNVNVLVIKLCDRLHNMLTLDALPPNKQKRISEETLVVYAPIAHKLGISKIKNLLEDLSFKYLYPKEYQEIDDYLKLQKQNLNFRLNTFIEKAKNILNNNGFKRDSFEVIGRVKHRYSIYLKMQRKGVSIEEILDLLAIRIIVNDPIECYKVLGILHLNYNPIISRFKDYIALPKDNGYQTIHTTLFFDKDIVEVQIRTKQMHQVAEYGIAAHLKYKAGANNINLEWLDNLTQNSKSIDRFIETTKSDLFIDDVIVFSPAGDSYTLPQGSVVLDFAYAVHSEIGNLATSAFVNKESTSLLRTLKNGDVVKIVTNDKPVLHCSWANVVKTSKAKEGIKAICKQRIREVNKKVAYLIIATMLNLPKDDIVKSVKELNLEKNIHKVTSHLDRLKVVLHKIIKYKNIKEVKFWEILKKGYKKPTLKHMEYFNIYSNRNIDSLEFDYCCHPKLGDEVIAFLERNRVFVHHKLCSKAYEKIKQNSDMVYIEWRDKQSSRYRIIVSLPNKRGVLLELLKELNKLDLNITAIDFNIKDSNNADYCKLEVETTSERSNQIKDIISQKVKIIQFIKLNDAYKS